MSTTGRRSAWSFIGAILAGSALTGCASTPAPALTSSIHEPALSQQVDANFHPGMTIAEVQTQLDALHIPPARRRLYPGPPERLLARLFPKGGFWVHEPEFEDIYYEDLWFVFDADHRLQRTDLECKRMRIQAHQYIDHPFHTPELLPDRPRQVPTAAGATDADQ